MKNLQIQLLRAALVEMENILQENVNECVSNRNCGEGSNYSYFIDGLKRVSALIEEIDSLETMSRAIEDLGHNNLKWVAEEMRSQLVVWKNILRVLNRYKGICSKEDENDLLVKLIDIN